MRTSLFLEGALALWFIYLLLFISVSALLLVSRIIVFILHRGRPETFVIVVIVLFMTINHLESLILKGPTRSNMDDVTPLTPACVLLSMRVTAWVFVF